MCIRDREYVDGKGKDFRLLFMVDEVGQYIGDDGDLMINLQSLVEEIGIRCHGKVWVMVTSQEAIDSVVPVSYTHLDVYKRQRHDGLAVLQEGKC